MVEKIKVQCTGLGLLTVSQMSSTIDCEAGLDHIPAFEIPTLIVSALLLLQSAAVGVSYWRTSAARPSGAQDDDISSSKLPVYLFVWKFWSGVVLSLVAIVVSSLSLADAKHDTKLWRKQTFYLSWAWLLAVVYYRLTVIAGFKHMHWVVELPLLEDRDERPKGVADAQPPFVLELKKKAKCKLEEYRKRYQRQHELETRAPSE